MVAKTPDIKSTDDNFHLKNIYQTKHPFIYPKCADEQTNEDGNLTLIGVSMFYSMNYN